MPDTLHLLPFGSHQYLGGKGEMKKLFEITQPVSSNWQKEDSNPGVSTSCTPRARHPASRNGRQNVCAKASLTRTFLHLIYTEK